MGNQIKFSPKKKDESYSEANDDYRALEIKNIQLKTTNRKLISKLDQQQQLVKNLNSELESFKNNKQIKNYQKLKKDHQSLLNENKRLQKMLDESQMEIVNLNGEIKKLKEKLEKDSSSSSRWNKLKNLRN